MVLKSYFDGGNQVNPQYDRVSLATVCGTSNQWKSFNTDWGKVLYRHGADFLHTTDAVSLQNEFSVDRGWDDKRVDALIDDCVSVIDRHINVPSGMRGVRPRNGLLPITLTIPFADWLQARKDKPSLPNTIEELCATECMSFAFKRARYLGAKALELYFDQGERFYGHVRDRYENPKAKKDIAMMSKVIHLGESDTRRVPALQMADLFAWGINHANQERRSWHVALHVLPFDSLILQYEHLVNPRAWVLERMKSWKLPTRRPSERILLRPDR